MRLRRKTAIVAGVLGLVGLGAAGGATWAVADSPVFWPETGVIAAAFLTNGPGSGEPGPTAGTGTIAAGSQSATLTIEQPACFGEGGGMDSNHGLAVLDGKDKRVWITGVRVTPLYCTGTTLSGTLTIYLNRPAPKKMTFTFWTFGLFND